MTRTALERLVAAFSLAVAVLLTGDGVYAQVSGQTKGQSPPAGPAYYVVLDTTSKTCKVVDKEPQTDSAHITVATDAVFGTRAEAEKAIPTLKPCTQ